MKKKFITGLLLISFVAIVLDGCKKDKSSLPDNGLNYVKFNPTLGYGRMTDQEGNIYKTITIGTQTWMAENLCVTTFRNGDLIPIVTPYASWRFLTTGAYCWYNNDAATYKTTYGTLYNWYAVADKRNIAPLGWHVPTDAEWTTLTDYLGGKPIAGGKLKEAGTTHWLNPNTDASNGSGFTALPAGYRYYNTFIDNGNFAYWWSSSENCMVCAWGTLVYTNGCESGIYGFDKCFGFSVRCIKDSQPVLTISTTVASSIGSKKATNGGNITDDGGSEVKARGVCWSTSHNPTTANSKTINGTGVGPFTSNLTGLSDNTNYYLRAYATNSAGTSYGNEVWFITLDDNAIVTDIDGNVYHYIEIGSQTWMAENLKTTKYRNGDPIPNVTVTASWTALTTGAYCWYDNDAANYKATYGALYNWYAVADSRNIAPVGWHVPTDAEWTTLTDFLGGKSYIGGKLKESGTSHWLTPNTGATNESGFTALPGGGRYFDEGSFRNVGRAGYWWSSTVGTTFEWEALLYRVSYDDAVAYRGEFFNKMYGFSVRCVKN